MPTSSALPAAQLGENWPSALDAVVAVALPRPERFCDAQKGSSGGTTPVPPSGSVAPVPASPETPAAPESPWSPPLLVEAPAPPSPLVPPGELEVPPSPLLPATLLTPALPATPTARPSSAHEPPSAVRARAAARPRAPRANRRPGADDRAVTVRPRHETAYQCREPKEKMRMDGNDRSRRQRRGQPRPQKVPLRALPSGATPLVRSSASRSRRHLWRTRATRERRISLPPARFVTRSGAARQARLSLADDRL